MPTKSPPTEVVSLTTEQVKRRDELKPIIQRGVSSFKEVGLALKEYRDSKLYLLEHATFEDYLRDELGFSRAYGYQIMKAAEVAKNVSAIADIPNESTARELSGLSQKQQVKAATELAKLGRPATRKDAKNAGAKVSPKKKEDDKKKQKRAEDKKRTEMELRDKEDAARFAKENTRGPRGGYLAEKNRAAQQSQPPQDISMFYTSGPAKPRLFEPKEEREHDAHTNPRAMATIESWAKANDWADEKTVQQIKGLFA